MFVMVRVVLYSICLFNVVLRCERLKIDLWFVG